MSREQWSAVDAYLNETLLARDEILDDVLLANAAAGLPSIDVAPNQGKLLQLLAEMAGARRVLEVGTLGGYSTIWLARGVGAEGSVLTLEVNPKHAAVAKDNIARAGHAATVEIRFGPALDSLAHLVASAVEPFDLIFLDADKPNNPNYLVHALALSRPGTLIIGDNVIRDGAVADAESEDPNARGARQFLQAIGRHPRLSATALQTVGGKGWGRLRHRSRACVR